MNRISRDGVSIAYVTRGDPDGEPVVFVHGLGADHEMWGPQLRSYQESGFYLVAPDLRGHGASDSVSSFAIQDCADDLLTLLDELGLERAAVVGVSMGGTVAQRFAISNPDRVSKMVLVDTFSSVHGPIARLNARAAEIGLSILPPAWQWRILESHFGAPDQAALREYFRTMLFETEPMLLKQARRAVNQFNCTDELKRITAPTLVLVGEDNGTWFENLARETADGITDAQFRTLRNASDPSNLSAPDAFDDAVLPFLESAVH